MFIITPQSRCVERSGRGSVARAPARVKKACDRCRVKKMKCNGEIPCRRCQSDGIYCEHNSRPTGDHKSLSRDYIASLEAQLRSLRQLCTQIGGTTHGQNTQLWQPGTTGLDCSTGYLENLERPNVTSLQSNLAGQAQDEDAFLQIMPGSPENDGTELALSTFGNVHCGPLSAMQFRDSPFDYSTPQFFDASDLAILYPNTESQNN